jgi:hydrogenase 3 maturation protease
VLRGDDAAGPAVVRALSGRLKAASARPAGAPTLLLLDAAHAPENQTGPLRRFAPDLIVLVDAARMDEPPGIIRWLSWEETAGIPASTHTLPPSLLAEYLARDLGCAVALIGIQPLDLELGAELSPAVRSAAADVAAGLADLLELGHA